MAVQLIVDSASDLLPKQCQALGIVHMPLKVRFNTTEYLDSVDLTHREFYEKLIESDEIPATSQIPPAEFEEAYRRVKEAGDTAVVITVSGKLSGTCQSAMIAREGYEDCIFVVDSENVCIGERILALRAVKLREAGLSAPEIALNLEREKGKIRVLALLDTLEHLKKGGRISSAAAFAGGLLSIKPVIEVKNGEIVLIGKARGSKQGNNLLHNLVSQSGGIDFDRPLCLAYSGLSSALLQKYITDSRDLWQDHTENLPIATIGCVIGTHAGPGAIAVAFFEK